MLKRLGLRKVNNPLANCSLKMKKSTSSKVSVIQPGCCVNGKIEVSGVLEIMSSMSGEIVGEIVNLHVGSVFNGAIRSETCRVHGKMIGTIIANRVVVSKGGEVHGDVHYFDMAVECGGVIVGKCEYHQGDLDSISMNRSKPKDVDAVNAQDRKRIS